MNDDDAALASSPAPSEPVVGWLVYLHEPDAEYRIFYDEAEALTVADERETVAHPVVLAAPRERAAAEPSNAEIEEVFERLRYDAGYASHIELARAVLALRPQGEPPVIDWVMTGPDGVTAHPKTRDLVKRFAAALEAKLAAAEAKYGYGLGWMNEGWMEECRHQLRHHVEKGDPRDVAAYCAFLWHHGASTATPAPAGAQPPVPEGEAKP